MGIINFLACVFMWYTLSPIWKHIRKKEKAVIAVIFLVNAGYVVYDLFKFLS
jgi:hypothetical protein